VNTQSSCPQSNASNWKSTRAPPKTSEGGRGGAAKVSNGKRVFVDSLSPKVSFLMTIFQTLAFLSWLHVAKYKVILLSLSLSLVKD
jgi:hypothetical protein